MNEINELILDFFNLAPASEGVPEKWYFFLLWGLGLKTSKVHLIFSSASCVYFGSIVFGADFLLV